MDGFNIAIARSTLPQVAAERLRALIIEGVLAPGARLNERELSEQLGLSRTPLREAFRLLDDFAAMRGGEDAEKARAKRAELAAERDDYHIDRLQQARYELDKRRDPSAAVWWLVHSIIWLGDPALADEAARFLVRMPDLDEHLRGYETEYPDKHAALLQIPIVKAWAAEHP